MNMELLKPLLGFYIVQAIFVVMFALWAEYYGHTLKQIEEAHPDFDRAEEMQRVRGVSTCAYLSLVFIAVAQHAVFKAHAVAALAGFSVALVAMTYVRAGVEKKIRKLDVQGVDQMTLIFKSILFLAGVLVTVTFSVAFFTVGATLLGQSLGLTVMMKGYLNILGAFCGMSFAVGLMIATAPMQLRLMLPCKYLEAGEQRAFLAALFVRARLPEPDFMMIEMAHFGYNNAMVSGLSFGRGPFKQTLFLTRGLFERFSKEEVEAIVSHEIAHLKMRHIEKRAVVSIAVICAVLLVSLALIAAAVVLKSQAMVALLTLLTPVLGFVSPYIAARIQVKKQEFEADLISVFQLGAKLEALASAMRKMDELNDLLSNRKSAEAMVTENSAHPTTEARIFALKLELERRLLNAVGAEQRVASVEEQRKIA